QGDARPRLSRGQRPGVDRRVVDAALQRPAGRRRDLRSRFRSQYLWRAVVTKSVADTAFELRLTEADADWIGSVVGFELMPSASGTQVRFYHRGWREPNEHYRISSHCWAMYLRILRRHLEHGESVPYDRRLDV